MEDFRNLNPSNPLDEFFDFTTYNGPPPELQLEDYAKMYKDQLDSLLELGFDKYVCLQALKNSKGDFETALEWIEENQS